MGRGEGAFRVVVLAPTRRDTGLTVRILGEAGLSAVACSDVRDVAARLGEGAGVVFVTEEALLRDREGVLAGALRSQPAWSDVPVLVLARGGRETAVTGGVLDMLGNATLIERPVRIATLLSHVRAAVRERRRQYQLRDHLDELRRNQAALAASEARYRAIGEAIPYGVWVADATGAFAYVSEVFLDLIGMSLDDVRREGWHSAVPAAERADAERRFRAALAAGGMFDLQTRVVGHEGQVRTLLVRGVPLRDELGAIGSWVGLNLDVTEKDRMEDEMARVGRLESVALLAGGVAHDFNNILTAILGNISLARHRVPTGSPAEQRLDAAERACAQAQSLVRQLLTFARGGAPVRRALDIAGVVREAAGFALQGAAVASQFAASPDLWPVEADAGQINQVVHNLVLNGSQAMDGRGVVQIAASNVEVGARSDLPLPPGRYVAVSVTDQGKGIAAEDLGRIFDLFFTTKPGGSGLGLATAHSIVKRHGGHITVRSEVGRGATFTFYLPAANAPVDGANADAEDLAPTYARILVMDDDPAVRDIARETLVFLGYDVGLAGDGDEAIRRYEAALADGRPFDLLILDLTVPGGLGGRDTLARLRQAHPDVRAIVASGYSNDPVMADHAAHGFVAAVAKPYDVERLGAVVQRVLGAATSA